MIKITDKKNGIVFSLKGKISRMPTKLGKSEIETTMGQRKSESIRGVVDLSIRVDNMSQDDYYNLEIVFLSSNNLLDIEDSDRGTYYSNYYLSDDTLGLEEKEDLENKTYFYVGGLKLSKR